MKKLMIAAAAAAMTAGAFADLCDVDPVEVGCLAYDMKISVKTPVPKTIKCKADKSMCDTGVASCVTYAAWGKKTIKGFLWCCEYDCTTYGTLDGFKMALWDASSKSCYQTYSKTGDVGGNVPAFTMLRLGKKATDVEVSFDLTANGTDAVINKDGDNETATLTATLAGAGKFDTKNEYVKSASGYIAGTRTFTAAETIAYKYACEEDQGGSYFWDLCDEFDSWCEDTGTALQEGVVYGSWTLKVNTKAMKSGKSYTSYVPSYCIVD